MLRLRFLHWTLCIMEPPLINMPTPMTCDHGSDIHVMLAGHSDCAGHRTSTTLVGGLRTKALPGVHDPAQSGASFPRGVLLAHCVIRAFPPLGKAAGCRVARCPGGTRSPRGLLGEHDGRDP